MKLFNLNLKDKLYSAASSLAKHSSHTVLSTVCAGLAFGIPGAVVGLGLGLVDEFLIYNNVIDYHYLSYTAMAVSTSIIVGSVTPVASFVKDVIETTLVLSLASSFDHNSQSQLVEATTHNLVFDS